MGGNIGIKGDIKEYKKTKAEQTKKRNMHNAAKAYQEYRPEYSQAKLNAARQSAGLFDPVNAALGSMYGPQAQFNIDAAYQNPMSERMQGLGAPTDPKSATPGLDNFTNKLMGQDAAPVQRLGSTTGQPGKKRK